MSGAVRNRVRRERAVAAAIVGFAVGFGSSVTTGCAARSSHHGAAQEAVAAVTEASHPDSLRWPVMEYTPPFPAEYRVELPRGAIAYLVPSDELPLISLKIAFREEGWSGDSADVAPYAFLGGMIRRGGSGTLSPSAVEDSLEQHAVSLGIGIGGQTSTLTLDALDSEFEEFFPLLQLTAFEPQIDSIELELMRARVMQSIAHRYDRPNGVSRDLFHTVLFGSTDPRLWRPESSEVAGVTREQLLRMAQGRFHPEKAVIAISGKFDREKMAELLSRKIGEWPAQGERRPASPSPSPRLAPGLHLLDFDSEQAHIRMGQPFVRRPHPDYYPTAVASYILGSGGFTSRLTAAVRSREGLAYSVGSYAESKYDGIGIAGITLQTKAESAVHAIGLIFEEIDRLTEEGPTPEELTKAVDGLIGTLPSLFDSPENTADALLWNEIWERGDLHYREYPDRLRAVTSEEIRRVLRLYFAPDRMAITVVGPADRIMSSRDQFPELFRLPVKKWSSDHLRSRSEP